MKVMVGLMAMQLSMDPTKTPQLLVTKSIILVSAQLARHLDIYRFCHFNILNLELTLRSIMFNAIGLIMIMIIRWSLWL